MLNNEHTEKFKLESGVKQGDLLAATLFSIFVDVILKQLYWRGKLSTLLKVFCLCWWCIDNYKNKTVTNMFQKLKNQSIHFGLTVNEQKKNKIFKMFQEKNWSKWCRYRFQIFRISKDLAPDEDEEIADVLHLILVFLSGIWWIKYIWWVVALRRQKSSGA